MQLKQDQKLLIFIGVFTTFAVLIFACVIIPTVSYIKQADQDTNNLRDYLEKKYDRSVNAHESIKQIEKIKIDVASFDDYIYRNGNELKLVTLLEDLALHASVTQKIVSSNLDQVTDQHVTVSLSLTGTYQNTITYLANLEKAPYFITINHLSLSPITDRTDPTKSLVNLNLDLSLYAAN